MRYERTGGAKRCRPVERGDHFLDTGARGGPRE